MGIEDIKRWQWILIGLLAGFGLGWVWSGVESTDTGRQISQIDFERDITRSHPKTKEPFIRNIVIQPATEDYAGRMVQPVAFQRLQQGAKTGNTYYIPGQYIASIPYKPMWNALTPANPNLTVEQYLENVAKRNASLQFKYGWYKERPAALAIWTLGTAAIVGGIWPTLLNLMVGAGLGGQREEKAKKEDYFDRFSSAPDKAAAKTGPVVTDVDRQQLDDMNRSLEEQLAAAGVAQTAPTDGLAKPGEQVRKLEGGPLEKSAAMKTGDEDDEIEIKGEFYPVLIHHKKHHEDEGAGKPDGHDGAEKS